MVKTGQQAIRRVRFLPPAPSVGDIEVNTLAGIRDRGGPHEFLTSQRLDFDLLVHVESGTARAHRRLHRPPAAARRRPVGARWPGPPVGSDRRHRGHRRDVRPPQRRRPRPRPDPVAAGPPPGTTGPPPTWPARRSLQALDLLTQRRRLAGDGAERVCARPPSPTASPRSSLQLALAQPAGRRRRHRDRPTRRTPGSATTSRSTSGTGTRSASTPNGWATPPAPSTASPGSTPASPPRSSSTSASSWKPSGSSATPTRPVAEIAEQLGFDDASNFSSYFRRQTGTTPGTFRTQSRSGH